MNQPNKAILPPGTVVAGRYRIEGIVGRGGFGAVYEATHLDTGRHVALKVLLKNFSTSETDARRFQREAALVQKLQHPNVVEIYDFGYTERQQPYISFELLKGESLGDAIKGRGALNFQKLCGVTRDVLGALGAAHDVGIIHRDVKPQNIFLCNDGSAKVLDFGIAKAVRGQESQATQLTETGQMLGTPQYMAPEQVRGADIVPATDIYALGLLLGEMISGERVVPGGALIDVYMAHISDEPFELHPAVAASALSEVVRKAIAKPLEQRYGSAAEMLAALNGALLGGDAAVAGPLKTREMAQQAPQQVAPADDFDPLNATIMMPESYEPPTNDEDEDSLAATSYSGYEELDMGTVVMTPERHAEHVAALEARVAANNELDGTLEMLPPDPPSAAMSNWPSPPNTLAQPPVSQPIRLRNPAAGPARTVPFNAAGTPSLMSAMHEGTGNIPAEVVQRVSGIGSVPPVRDPQLSRDDHLDDGRGSPILWAVLVVLVAALVTGVLWLAPWQ